MELSAKRLICQRTDGRDDRERSQELGFIFERRASSDSEREGTVETKLIFQTAWTRSHRLNGGHSIPESGPVIHISCACCLAFALHYTWFMSCLHPTFLALTCKEVGDL